MPKPTRGPRLGGSPAHQRHMLANLATQLFEHGRIKTTETKARRLRPVAEKLITKAKKAHLGQNPLHQRRVVLKTIKDKTVVHELFTEIGPRFADRPGGYTRITKIGPRQGDQAPMAIIELVTEEYSPKPARAKKEQAAPAPAPVEEAPAEGVAEEPAAEEVPAEEGEASEAEATEEAAEETAEAEEPAVEAEATEESAEESEEA